MNDVAMKLGLLAAVLSVGACTELEDIRGGICGNGVVESGEDCDGDKGCNPAGKAGACRFGCETAGECKPGWVCGADAICREPTGEFAAAKTIITGEQIGVVVGELNGSRPADLVSVSPSGEITARFGGGAMLETATFKSRPILPAVGKLSTDTVDDLAHGTQRALGVLLGTPQKALRPMAYSPIAVGNAEARYVITEAKKPASPKEFLYALDEILEFTPAKDGATTIVIDAYDPNPVPIVKLPFPIAKLTPAPTEGEPPVGNLDARPTSPCNELVLAAEGSSEIIIYSPCKAGGLAWNGDLGALPKVTLAGGAAVSLGVSLADVDGDGRLDLFILGPSAASGYSTYLAFGAGDGTFNSTSPAVPGAVDNTAAELGFPAAALPLAAGDLNGDGRAELVFPGEVVWSESPCPKLGPSCFDRVLRNVEFLQARIGDFNRNGVADLATIVQGSRNLYFLDGNGTRFPTAHEIPTDGEPTGLAVGDFDGDLVLDLAIAQKEGGALGSGGDQVGTGNVFTVAFGNVQGPPNPPKRMGELGRIDGMAPGHLAMRGLDLMTDVGVLGLDQSKVLSVAIFNGANNRQMQSPFELSLGAENPDAPAAVQLGRFVGEGPQKDIAVLGRGESGTRLWLAPTTGDAALSVESTNSTNLSALKEYVDPCSSHLAALDQDSDQLDELFIVSPNEPPKKGTRVVVAKVEKGSWKVAQSFELDDLNLGMHFARHAGCYLNATAGLGPNPGSAEPQGDQFLHGEVAVADVDGSGAPDLVLMGLATTADAFDSAVVVLPSGDPAAKAELSFPSGVLPFAIEFLNADGDPALELAYFAVVLPPDLSSSEPEFAVYLAEVDWASKSVTNTATLQSAAGATYDDNFPLNMSSGDFNGDGIIDVAMSFQFNTDIFFGKPVLE